MMRKPVRTLILVCLSVLLVACDFAESFAPPLDETEAALTATAFSAQLTADAPTATRTPTATPRPSVTPTATLPPTSTFTPTPTPSPDLTQAALADCLEELDAFIDCLNADALPIAFPDGAPDQPIADNADPTTLYRSPDILDMLTAPDVTMEHNYYTRPVNCPLGTACLLHLLLISFADPEAALVFFDRITELGMEGETVIPAPNAAEWDASKCATGSRPSTAAGAPPFAVIYCSVSLGQLHWGFNLSAYENLPEDFLTNDLPALLSLAYLYLSLWQAQVGEV